MLYVFGGEQASDLSMNDLWAFDLASKAWTRLQASASPASMPYQFSPPPLTRALLIPVRGEGLIVYGGMGLIGKQRSALGQAYYYSLAPTSWIPPLVDTNNVDQVQ